LKTADGAYHNLQVTKELNKLCELHRDGLPGHLGLLSYFYDNVNLRTIANDCKEKAERVKFQNIIDKLRSLEDTDSNEAEAIDSKIFTWENSFAEDGTKWWEYTWTQCLCGALLSEYTCNGKYNTQYTATYGESIIHDLNSLHYIFQKLLI